MSNSTNLVKAMACAVTGHVFKVSRVVNSRVEEYCCSKCKKQMTLDIYGDLQPLNDRYERINKALHDLAIKKHRRSTVLCA